MLIALIFLIIFGLVVLTGIILALAAGLWPILRLDFRLPFPAASQEDFFLLLRTLIQSDSLWHSGRGDLPDPTGEDQLGEMIVPAPPNIPFS